MKLSAVTFRGCVPAPGDEARPIGWRESFVATDGYQIDLDGDSVIVTDAHGRSLRYPWAAAVFARDADAKPIRKVK